jgi:hypothetical protein
MSKKMFVKCLTDEYCDFTKSKVYEILEVDSKEKYYKFANDKGETQWLRFKQCEIVNVLKDSTVKNKPSNCTREHCVIENDTCDNYMAVDLCTLKEDNNPSPLEELKEMKRKCLIFDEMVADNVEQEIGNKEDTEKEFKIVKQALTNYANMVERLEELVEKYELSTKKIHEVGGFVSMAIIQFITDITKVLEGKIK